MLTTGLIGRLRSLLKPLPFLRGLAHDPFAYRAPFLLQMFDAVGQCFWRFRRTDQRLHFRDEFETLGRHGVILPLLELVQLLIELQQLADQRGGERPGGPPPFFFPPAPPPPPSPSPPPVCRIGPPPPFPTFSYTPRLSG